MRLLFGHNAYQQAGGEDVVFEAERSLLQQHGHAVATYRSDNEELRQMGSLEIAARTVWNPHAYAAVKDLVGRTDAQIAHFHNTFPLASPAVLYAAKAAGARVVLTLHNYRLLCPVATFYRDGHVCQECLHAFFAWPGVKHACYRGSRAASATVATMTAIHRSMGTWRQQVDLYIATSEFSRDKFIEGGFDPSKITVKPHFLEHDPGAGYGTGGFALFVGRLSHEKGLLILLEAWAEGRGPIPLVIVGDGPLAPVVAAAAAKEANVTWLGRLQRPMVYSLMRDAAIVVVPSECFETFGLVVIEAFASGTPVVGVDHGAVAELVDHGRTGRLFQASDAADLRRQVELTLGDKAELGSMRSNARHEYESHYTAFENYKRLISIYERVL